MRQARVAVQRLDFSLRFLNEFAREPFQVGALLPSSQALARVVVDSCHLKPGALVVELGSGTGSFTGLLLQRLHHRGRLVAVEINPTHVSILRRRFPRCEVIHDSAEYLPRYLDGRQTDCVVSGLAWAAMPAPVQDRIFRAVLDVLKPEGQFIAFAYWHARWFRSARRFRRLLLRRFEQVGTSPVVWRNLPPAYVYRCAGPRAS
jgi:phosphatidylethanolamine/phosphatidyl-N-methylethanolamine N-methyltransferase